MTAFTVTLFHITSSMAEWYLDGPTGHQYNIEFSLSQRDYQYWGRRDASSNWVLVDLIDLQENLLAATREEDRAAAMAAAITARNARK